MPRIISVPPPPAVPILFIEYPIIRNRRNRKHFFYLQRSWIPNSKAQIDISRNAVQTMVLMLPRNHALPDYQEFAAIGITQYRPACRTRKKLKVVPSPFSGLFLNLRPDLPQRHDSAVIRLNRKPDLAMNLGRKPGPHDRMAPVFSYSAILHARNPP